MMGPRILLKRHESYAIHALIHICENPGVSAAEIAARLEIPPAFLAKVLKKLVDSGYIESHMGRGGGVSLRHEVNDLSLLEVIEGLSGPLILDTCQSKARCATQERKGHCRLKMAWIGTTASIRKLLGEVKFKELCEGPSTSLETAPLDSAPAATLASEAVEA